jgi:hypothetical protein
MSVFICYRRDDAQDAAGRLLASLRLALGRDRVFMDITGIDIGTDFRVEIDRALTSCAALLAVIGNRWLIAADGSRRLEDNADFVRLEIAGALARGIAVIPVLVQDARMPTAPDLPVDMEQLAWRNAVELRHSRWDDDVAALAKALKRQIAGQSTGSSSPPDDAPARAAAAPADRHRSSPADRGRAKRRAASKEPVPLQASEQTEAWKLAAAAQVESTLIDSVGPLGRVILRRELAKAASPDALCLALESHLPDPAGRTAVRRAILAATTPGPQARQPAAPPSAEAVPLPSVPSRAEVLQRSPAAVAASLPQQPPVVRSDPATAPIAAAARSHDSAEAIEPANPPWRAIAVALPVIAFSAFLAWRWGGLGPAPRPEPESSAVVNAQRIAAKSADEPRPAASDGSGRSDRSADPLVTTAGSEPNRPVNGVNTGAGAGSNAEASAPAPRSPARIAAAARGETVTPIPAASATPPAAVAPSGPAPARAPPPSPVAATVGAPATAGNAHDAPSAAASPSTDPEAPAVSAAVPATSRSEVAVAGPEAPSAPAAPALVKVPYVVCATETQARKALADIGLKVEVEYVSALGNGGCGSPSHVLSQTPMSGKAEIATVIKLRVRQ